MRRFRKGEIYTAWMADGFANGTQFLVVKEEPVVLIDENTKAYYKPRFLEKLMPYQMRLSAFTGDLIEFYLSGKGDDQLEKMCRMQPDYEKVKREEREAMLREIEELKQDIVKKRMGRPPGSKNKPKLGG